MLFYYIMWLRIRRDWSTQCVCVLKFMCFFSICVCAACELKWCHLAQDPMSSEPITRNHSSQTTTNSICLPLLHALNGLDIRMDDSLPYFMFFFLSTPGLYWHYYTIKAGKAKYISIYLFTKAIPEVQQGICPHPGCSLWSCTLQAGDGLWARFRWTLIWQCTHHKTHCVFGACLLWRILCTLPTSCICNWCICRLDDGAIKFSATVSSESSRVPERNPRNNFSELVEKIR